MESFLGFFVEFCLFSKMLPLWKKGIPQSTGIPVPDQDIELMARAAEHLNYDFRIIQPQKEKNSYMDLNLSLMYEYLNRFVTKEMPDKFRTAPDFLRLSAGSILILKYCFRQVKP